MNATPPKRIPPLTDENAIVVVRPRLAAAVGLTEAILLERVWWMQHARAYARVIGARRFVLFPPRDMRASFPFCSTSTLERAARKLAAAGMLIRARLKDAGGDAASWVSVDRDEVGRVVSLYARNAPPESSAESPAEPEQAPPPLLQNDGGVTINLTEGDRHFEGGTPFNLTEGDRHFEGGTPFNLTEGDRQNDGCTIRKESKREIRETAAEGAAAADAALQVAAGMLRERGFSPADAAALAGRFGPAGVAGAVGRFDQVVRGGRVRDARGWIVGALERGDTPVQRAPAPGAFNVPADPAAQAERRRADAEHKDQERAVERLTGPQWAELAGPIRARWAELFPGRPCPDEPWRYAHTRAIARAILFPSVAEVR